MNFSWKAFSFRVSSRKGGAGNHHLFPAYRLQTRHHRLTRKRFGAIFCFLLMKFRALFWRHFLFLWHFLSLAHFFWLWRHFCRFNLEIRPPPFPHCTPGVAVVGGLISCPQLIYLRGFSQAMTPFLTVPIIGGGLEKSSSYSVGGWVGGWMVLK